MVPRDSPSPIKQLFGMRFARHRDHQWSLTNRVRRPSEVSGEGQASGTICTRVKSPLVSDHYSCEITNRVKLACSREASFDRVLGVTRLHAMIECYKGLLE